MRSWNLLLQLSVCSITAFLHVENDVLTVLCLCYTSVFSSIHYLLIFIFLRKRFRIIRRSINEDESSVNEYKQYCSEFHGHQPQLYIKTVTTKEVRIISMLMINVNKNASFKFCRNRQRIRVELP